MKFLLFAGAAATVMAETCSSDAAKVLEVFACVAKLDMMGDACTYQQGAIDCGNASGCYDQDDCDDLIASAKALNCDVTCAPGCFPATALVELSNGKTKSMDQLVIGDKVRVGPKEFSEVYYFSSEMPETTSKFVSIATSKNTLHLTQGHYLYVNGELVQAKTVKVGDVITTANGTKEPVTSVDAKWAPGLYNPHTMTGDIVVDGVLTSTYTDAVHPTLAHALLMPLRQMYTAGASFGPTFQAMSKSVPTWVRDAIKAAY